MYIYVYIYTPIRLVDHIMAQYCIILYEIIVY